MKSVFVTVGSTSFDSLSRAVLTISFQHALLEAGYTRLTLQHGTSGTPLPDAEHVTGLTVETFAYAPNLSDYVYAADLIISHAGAGSIIEALKAGKTLIVVANESLMDNHQLELTNELSHHQYCLAATPSTLIDTVKNMKNVSFKALEQKDGAYLDKVLREELAMLDKPQSRCEIQ